MNSVCDIWDELEQVHIVYMHVHTHTHTHTHTQDPAGHYGAFKCDLPMVTLELLLDTINQLDPQPDFIVYTGGEGGGSGGGCGGEKDTVEKGMWEGGEGDVGGGRRGCGRKGEGDVGRGGSREKGGVGGEE